MNILVLVKQTFDTEEKVIIQDGQIAEEGVEFVINPYDEYAIEEAVKWKEEAGGEVTVLSFGPARAESALRKALAMGADQAVLIERDNRAYDEAFAAELLAAACRNRPFDLILGGNMAVDSGAGQVAIRVAELLGIPHVSSVTGLSIQDRTATLERDAEGDIETVEAALPLLVTAQQGLNEPRYPSLPGIMKAKKKPLECVTAEALGLSAVDTKPRTKVVQQYSPPKKQAGQLLQGDVKQQVGDLVQFLRAKDKVI